MKLIHNGPTVLISAEAEQKIRHWVDCARGEVSGLGTVIHHEDGFLIEEVYLLKQRCTGSHTELDDEAVAALLVELDTKGVDTGTVRFWWHSHGDLSAFWSGTDDSCIEGLANDNYMVSLVANKRRQDRVRIDQYTPIRLTLDEVPLRLHQADLGLFEECEKEFADKVEEIAVFTRRGRRGNRQPGKMTSAHLDGPPWPHDTHDEDDGHLLGDPDDEGWDDDWGGGWELHDDNPLALQVNDPWGCALQLEAYR